MTCPQPSKQDVKLCYGIYNRDLEIRGNSEGVGYTINPRKMALFVSL
jgi:hypothetical protein